LVTYMLCILMPGIIMKKISDAVSHCSSTVSGKQNTTGNIHSVNDIIKSNGFYSVE